MAENQTPEDESKSDDSVSQPSESPASSVAGGASSSEPSPSPLAAGADNEEGLPEWEPLSPEILEDEAIRGDFMLRWAVVLLAMLFGFTLISSTETLVHIKAGQYLTSNGWIPPKTDVLSYTATELPWVQLDWFFNILAAGSYAAVSAWGLTLLKAGIAAFIVGLLVHISRPGVPTWWNSVTAALFVVASYRQFTFRPELITLLGLALTFWLLHQWRLGTAGSIKWKLPLLFLIWANLDPRMFFGVVVLVLFAAGASLRKSTGSDGENRVDLEEPIWPVVATCLVVTLLNPFLWQSLTSAYSLFAVEYPALQAYNPVGSVLRPDPARIGFYPLWEPHFWRWIDASGVSAILLVLSALFGILVNWKRVDPAYVLPMLGLIGLTLPAADGLPAAAMAAAVVAQLNIQQWYQSTYTMTYEVKRTKILFSRLGRALTVVAFVGVALFVITGKIDPSGQTKVGLGFHPAFAARMGGVVEDLEDSLDDRPFNFRLEQGDLMIWAGQRSFVDSRVRVFAQPSDETILDQHQKCRLALRKKNPQLKGSGEREVWREILDQHEVTHVVPRLYGDSPDYQTYFDLWNSRDWTLTRIGASSAVLYRLDKPDNLDLMKYIEDRFYNIIVDAFQGDELELSGRVDWAREPGFYETYLTNPQKRSNNQQLARHMLEHVERLDLYPDAALAFGHRAVQLANRALEDDSQNAEAYRTLGLAYALIGRLETQLVNPRGTIDSMRYLQSVEALNQAARIEPEDETVQSMLYRLYSITGKQDLKLAVLDRLMKLQGTPTEMTADEFEAFKAYSDEYEKLTKELEPIQTKIRESLEEAAGELNAEKVIEIAIQAFGQGCPKLASEILDENLALIEDNPGGLLLRATLLLEIGQEEEAFEEFGKLEVLVEKSPMADYYMPAAAAALGFGDYLKATKIWYDKLSVERGQQQQAMDAFAGKEWMMTMPLLRNPQDSFWPIGQLAFNMQIIREWPNQLAETRIKIAQNHLETGKKEQAIEVLEQISESAPDSPLRPLVNLYLYTTTGEVLPEVPDYGWVSPDDAELDVIATALPKDEPEKPGVDADGKEKPFLPMTTPDDDGSKK